MTNPATETKSTGLLANAVVLVFTLPSGQFQHDVTTLYLLPGLNHLDNFTLTRKLASGYPDFAKTHTIPSLHRDPPVG
jgi:hypothetical protein